VIAVEGLSHAYDGDRLVLDAVALEVPAGAVVGLVGPNGAGKTTLMRTIATLLRPRGGRVTVGGHDVVAAPEAVRRLIGYLPERTMPYPDLLCWEHLDFFARASGVAAGERKDRVAAALAVAGLTARRDAPVKSLSKGLRQRLALQAVLIHRPRALVLDEVTDGLDPESRAEVLAAVRALADGGCAVLLSSHVLAEVEEVADGVVILVDGRRQDAAPTAPPARAFHLRVRERAEAAEALLASHPDVAGVSVDGDRLRVALRAFVPDAAGLAAALIGGGFALTELAEVETTLARTFQEVVARTRKGAESQS
jgi:ABC-2 type transport system ATP-binding protein